MPGVDEIIAQIPAWKSAQTLQVETLAGLTNTNYVVTVDEKRFVLRISGPNTERLGVKREYEGQALQVASKAGIGPEVLHLFLPEGHLVTRYIEGCHLKLEEYRTRENLQRIVKTVKRLHDLSPVEAKFSPFRRVEKYANQVQSMGVPLPTDFEKMVGKMNGIEYGQSLDSYPWRRFCHNDLFSVNVLDDGKIWFIDWEFAGMGDIYYDLATLTYAYDSTDTLSPTLQRYLLECYFGDVNFTNWTRLTGMKYMVMFFSAMWGLLQQGMQNEGLVRAVEGFDFVDYADTTFTAMRMTFDE